MRFYGKDRRRGPWIKWAILIPSQLQQECLFSEVW